MKGGEEEVKKEEREEREGEGKSLVERKERKGGGKRSGVETKEKREVGKERDGKMMKEWKGKIMWRKVGKGEKSG